MNLGERIHESSGKDTWIYWKGFMNLVERIHESSGKGGNLVGKMFNSSDWKSTWKKSWKSDFDQTKS